MHSSERTVTAVLTPDLAAKVRREAHISHRTVSAYIRDVLARHIAARLEPAQDSQPDGSQ